MQQDRPVSQVSVVSVTFIQHPVHPPAMQFPAPDAEQLEGGAGTQHQPWMVPHPKCPSPLLIGSKPFGQSSQRTGVQNAPPTAAQVSVSGAPVSGRGASTVTLSTVITVSGVVAVSDVLVSAVVASVVGSEEVSFPPHAPEATVSESRSKAEDRMRRV
jgi:hypothetical protein